MGWMEDLNTKHFSIIVSKIGFYLKVYAWTLIHTLGYVGSSPDESIKQKLDRVIELLK